MILDSNILIAYLNGDDQVREALSDWKRTGRSLFISSLSITEVLAYPPLSPRETEDAKLFLNEFIPVSFDSSLAETAAFLRRLYGIATPDAAIAATALTRGVPLVTRDRQFRKVKELILVQI